MFYVSKDLCVAPHISPVNNSLKPLCLSSSLPGYSLQLKKSSLEFGAVDRYHLHMYGHSKTHTQKCFRASMGMLAVLLKFKALCHPKSYYLLLKMFVHLMRIAVPR